MIMVLIVGLVSLCLAGLYVLESSASMILIWGLLGIVCVTAYLVSYVSNKVHKD